MDDTIHFLSNWDQAKVWEVYASVAPKCYSSRPFPTFLYKYVWATGRQITAPELNFSVK